MVRCKRGTAKTCKTVCSAPCKASKPRKKKAVTALKVKVIKKKKTVAAKKEVAAVGTGYEKYQNIEVPRLEKKYKLREIADKISSKMKKYRRR